MTPQGCEQITCCQFYGSNSCPEVSVFKPTDVEYIFQEVYSDEIIGGSEVKASACNAGNLGSIPGSRRSPGEENGNPLQ